MSSSIFIESCSKAFKGGKGSENEIAISGSPDSNLVVVYGKKGVNFDKRGIENLIGGPLHINFSILNCITLIFYFF